MKQTTLRIPKDLHEEIEAESEETGKSVSRIMRERLGEPRLRDEIEDEFDDVETRLRNEFRGEIARVEQRISELSHAEEALSPVRTTDIDSDTDSDTGTDTEGGTDSDTASERPLSDALAGEQVDIAQVLPSDSDALERERDAVEACLHTLVTAGRATRDELAALHTDHPAGYADADTWLAEVINPVLYTLAEEREALYTPEGKGGGRWVVPSSITLSDPTPPAEGAA